MNRDNKIDFIVIDWGTSSFRLWSMNKNGTILNHVNSDLGVIHLSSNNYSDIIENYAQKLNISQTVPVIISGMAGAKNGWVEAEYIETPANIVDIPNHAIKVPTIKRDVYILPGLCQKNKLNPNVMRGEETQLLGLYSKNATPKITCIPGTHSKWVCFANDTITSFTTAMTGEVFQSFINLPTLKNFIEVDNEDDGHIDFEKQFIYSLENPEQILQQLFLIRAHALLYPNHKKHSANQLSAMLIALEIASVKDMIKNEQIYLIASGKLAHKYSNAFDVASIKYKLVDAHQAAIDGLCYAAHSVLDRKKKQ